jgi:hypothetical protein
MMDDIYRLVFDLKKDVYLLQKQVKGLESLIDNLLLDFDSIVTQVKLGDR